MLFAEKAQLETNLAVEVLRVRDRELQFYSDAFSTIGTQAALVATLSVGLLALQTETLRDPIGGWLSAEMAAAWGVVRDVGPDDTGPGGWTVWTWLEQGVQFMELACYVCLVDSPFPPEWKIRGVHIQHA